MEEVMSTASSSQHHDSAMPPAHDTYARELSELGRGYPLYYPSHTQRTVSDDPSQRFGVPNDFECLDLGVVRTFKAALQPGPLHSGTISTLEADIGTQGGILPAEASFTFKWSKLYKGAVSKTISVDTATLGMRSPNPLTSTSDSGILFGNPLVPSAVGASASTGVERAGAVELRASEKHPWPGGPPLHDDHTVFIKAYRLGTRQASLNQKNLHATSDGSTQSSSGTPLGHSPRSEKYSDTMVIRPYNSDYHPSVALLGVAMEASDSDFVLIHDHEWCTASGDTDQFKIIEQYADFYFNTGCGIPASVMLDVEDDSQPLQSDEISNSTVMEGSGDFTSGIHSPDVDEQTLHQRTRKLADNGRGEVVWPPDLEAALAEGLELYKPDNPLSRILGRYTMENRFLSDYIFHKTGKRRTAKQVGSRLQPFWDTYGLATGTENEWDSGSSGASSCDTYSPSTPGACHRRR
ncbi:putative TEA/ATTS domain family protein [Lyophyllum shimeji]|uniref:TEA/ATTS domain family protein n=1 Tax=Lyophyllum shimeji TaxID=47721 RepID=A0A9P3Q2M9_LYOSH|nr:putative TEA/ATTS domain family protein [Lyophyllum shimeji]